MNLENHSFSKSYRGLIALGLLVTFAFIGCSFTGNTKSGSEEVTVLDNNNEELPQPQTEADDARISEAAVVEYSIVQESKVTTEEVETENMLKLFINNEEIQVNWEENESVEALKNIASNNPVIIDMSMYGGFEQVGSIGQSLPKNDKQMTTSAGDIVLYSGNQMVVFYGSNSWAYTKLGHISGMTEKELEKVLASGDVTITVSVNEK